MDNKFDFKKFKKRADIEFENIIKDLPEDERSRIIQEINSACSIADKTKKTKKINPNTFDIEYE